ncbi:hypothetical protein B7C42_07175 [Nocardia cerradoensis]|uniref:Uncharacterized protein n=1 Tax=Nocardia cerradoensis TaxID=85688 RepID=A0A231GW87_9NOCA|nr:DUF4157 domain-containing protein [Nocardia cerradoensis]OXR40751.1 hypothetical protein B7C42_07175 [Nocardia cerradoensis]
MTTPTVPVIVHRADEYHSAGEVFGQMSTDSVTTHSSLINVLTSYVGMAGSDSVGQQWADSYHESAQLAISASSKLTTSCGQIRDLLVVGAHNHEVAEITAHQRNLSVPPPPQLFPDPCMPSTAPNAAGDGIPEPFGWSIIKDAVGFAWPNGHQDQLNAAKNAWQTAAADYRTIAGQVPQAKTLLANQQSPEIDIAVQTSQERQNDFNALADVCDALGNACGDYAHHLDEAHHKILDELKEFVVETAVAEGIFAILAPVTGSLSEWVGNTAMAGRIAMKGRRIATIIGELSTKVAKIVTDAIKPLVGKMKPIFEKVRNWVDAAKIKLTPLDRGGAVLSDGCLFSRMGSRTNREVLDSGNHLPMTRETVEEYARRAGVDLTGVRFDIANSADDIRYYDSVGASASTSGDHIALAPSAFADEESLMRNLVHERVHIDQYAQGKVTNNLVTNELEDEAYAADERFWNDYLSGKAGH